MLHKIRKIEIKEVEVELKPGDRVSLDSMSFDLFRKRNFTIRRIVENRNQTYVVFSNSTWRPLSTYGKTWEKIG